MLFLIFDEVCETSDAAEGSGYISSTAAVEEAEEDDASGDATGAGTDV